MKEVSPELTPWAIDYRPFGAETMLSKHPQDNKPMIGNRKRGWIGIELGTHSVRLAQADRATGRLRIAASAVVRRAGAEDMLDDDHAVGWKGLSRELAAAIEMNPDFAGRKVACVLPMQQTPVSTVDVPAGGVVPRRTLVAGEAKSLFAREKQAPVFDFWEEDPKLTGSAPAGKKVNVLAASHGTVTEALEALRGAGLTCEVLDGLPFVLARAVGLAYGHASGGPIAAVHWGCSSGTFCIVVDGKPVFTRHLRNCGFSQIVRRTSEALGLSSAEASQLLSEYGLPDPNYREGRRKEIQDVIAEIATGPLSEVAKELTKTISFLQMQYPKVLPQRLCLFGDGATLANVTPSLAEKVGLPTDVWRLPDEEDQASLPPQTNQLGAAVALSTLAWI